MDGSEPATVPPATVPPVPVPVPGSAVPVASTSASEPGAPAAVAPDPDCGAVPGAFAGPASVGIAATTLPSDAAAHCGAVVPDATGSFS